MGFGVWGLGFGLMFWVLGCGLEEVCWGYGGFPRFGCTLLLSIFRGGSF